MWKSTDKGAHWTPIFDQQNRLSIGAIAIDPADHSIWVGTGEANTAFENYAGDGIYRSADGGQTWQVVGNQLEQQPDLADHVRRLRRACTPRRAPAWSDVRRRT